MADDDRRAEIEAATDALLADSGLPRYGGHRSTIERRMAIAFNAADRVRDARGDDEADEPTAYHVWVGGVAGWRVFRAEDVKPVSTDPAVDAVPMRKAVDGKPLSVGEQPVERFAVTTFSGGPAVVDTEPSIHIVVARCGVKEWAEHIAATLNVQEAGREGDTCPVCGRPGSCCAEVDALRSPGGVDHEGERDG